MLSKKETFHIWRIKFCQFLIGENLLNLPAFRGGHLKSISKVLSWRISDIIIKTRLKTVQKKKKNRRPAQLSEDVYRHPTGIRSVCVCVKLPMPSQNADGNLSTPSSGTASRMRIKGSTSIWERQQTEHLAHNYNPLKGNKRVTAQPFALILFCPQ